MRYLFSLQKQIGGTMRLLAAGTILSFMAIVASAQDPGTPAPAPLPVQILSGKRVFVSNATGESMVPAGSGELTYNQFYVSMKDWGRYELAAVPADADLIFEIHYEAGSGWVSVYKREGGSVQLPQIRLIVRDPKTRTVLWAFTEAVQAVGKKSTGMHNFQHSMAALMGDLKALTANPKK
jgi:hypothetical protein